MFELHAQLAADCLPIGSMNLSRLLLLNDANYPWFILVPQREGITEIHQLGHDDQALLIAESSLLARAIERVLRPDKLNIAALGNLVPQLHVHHIARYRTDVSWPAPVWGRVPAIAYEAEDARRLIEQVRAALADRIR